MQESYIITDQVETHFQSALLYGFHCLLFRCGKTSPTSPELCLSATTPSFYRWLLILLLTTLFTFWS